MSLHIMSKGTVVQIRAGEKITPLLFLSKDLMITVSFESIHDYAR